PSHDARRVNESSDSYRQPEHLAIIGDHLGHRPASQRGDRRYRLGRRHPPAGEGAPPREEPDPGEIDGDGGEVVGVHLEPDCGVCGTVRHEHRRWATDAVLGQAGFADESPVDELGDEARDGRLVEPGRRGDISARAWSVRPDEAKDNGQVRHPDIGEVGRLLAGLAVDHAGPTSTVTLSPTSALRCDAPPLLSGAALRVARANIMPYDRPGPPWVVLWPAHRSATLFSRQTN